MKKFNILIVMLLVIPFFASPADNEKLCSLGITYGFMLPDKIRNRITQWTSLKTWSVTGSIAHLNKKHAKFNSAIEMAFENTTINETYFVSQAKKLAKDTGSKCYGVANVRHDFQIDNGNITLFSFADIYTTD